MTGSETVADRRMTGRSQTILQSWNRFWFEPVSAEPMRAFRSVYGIYLFGYFIRFVPYVEVLFSDQGVYHPFLVPDYALPPAGAWAVYVATLVLTILVALQWRPAVASTLLLLAYLHHYFLQFAGSNYSYDRMNLVVLGVIVIDDIAHSFGSRPHAKDEHGGTVAAWATRLLQLELALMYFGSGLFKLLNPLWRDGHLIEMTLQGNWATPAGFSVVQLGLSPWVYDLAAWSVIAFELTLGPALYVPRLRYAAMAVGTCFHLANWILFDIPEFLSCPAMYLLFVPPETLRRLRLHIWRGKVQPTRVPK